MPRLEDAPAAPLLRFVEADDPAGRRRTARAFSAAPRASSWLNHPKQALGAPGNDIHGSPKHPSLRDIDVFVQRILRAAVRLGAVVVVATNAAPPRHPHSEYCSELPTLASNVQSSNDAVLDNGELSQARKTQANKLCNDRWRVSDPGLQPRARRRPTPPPPPATTTSPAIGRPTCASAGAAIHINAAMQ